MFFKPKQTQSDKIISALNASLAIIEFDMDGKILSANQNFLTAMGYEEAEIIGKKHAMFVEPAYAASPDYQAFWATLRQGKFQQAQFRRIGKNGREVWIEASYNPIASTGTTFDRVIKVATDVTREKMAFADLSGKVNAIDRTQAMIEFNLDGIILTANQNFLTAMGYELSEIQGKHHSMFVPQDQRDNDSYRVFWEQLRQGQFQTGQYKRVGKGGRDVWIEGAYNPVFDLNGNPWKVVKFATDITSQISLLSNLKTLIDVNFANIDHAIDQSESQADSVASAAGQTSDNVQTMATSAEELAASIAEIASSMARSQSATDQAFARMEAASQATHKLASAANAMDGIVGLIRDIAGQINLLALNATIESARAGAAGKGFAVVANEVKHLASQAAKATEQISQEIGDIQSISDDVVTALGGIQSAISDVREHVASTASAVEEQSMVTRDMSANMQLTSSAVDTISANIRSIIDAIQGAASALDKTQDAARILTY